jgi:hypothetical protein
MMRMTVGRRVGEDKVDPDLGFDATCMGLIPYVQNDMNLPQTCSTGKA